MKRIWLIIVVLSLGSIGLLSIQRLKDEPDTRPQVGVVFLLRHPAIDEGLQGFRAQLTRLQSSENFTVYTEYANAFGESKNIHTIIGSFLDKDHDAIVALTTPCAQVAKQMVKDRPVVFVGISDPIGAGLVNSLAHGTGNITGTMSRDPVFENLRLASRIFPKLRRVGILYNSIEANSKSIIASLEDQIVRSGIHLSLQTAAVSQTTELPVAAERLLATTDALFLINDNLIVSSADLLIRLAQRVRKPIFASDKDSVQKGALFSYGLDYRDEGVAAAIIVAQLLRDKKRPDQIPIYINTRYYLYVNRRITPDFGVKTSLFPRAKFI